MVSALLPLQIYSGDEGRNDERRKKFWSQHLKHRAFQMKFPKLGVVLKHWPAYPKQNKKV